MEKLYTVAGTATNRGITKVRFANDIVSRVKILAKAGCTDIDLVELPRAMTKLEALQWLEQRDVTGDAAYAISVKMAEKQREHRRRQVAVTLSRGTVKTTTNTNEMA